MTHKQFLRESNRHGEGSRHTPKYSIFQPQFKQETGPENSQDLYKATQYADPIYDVQSEYDHCHRGDTFDSFDQNLLLQPYDDRHRQAAQGRARLSLPSGYSKNFSNLTFSQPQRTTFAHEQSIYDDTAYLDPTKPSVCGRLGRFSYNDNQFHDSSSEIQAGLSSGPALRAGQRHAENILPAMIRDQSRPQSLQSGLQHVPEQTSSELDYSNHQFVPLTLDANANENHFPIMKQEQMASPCLAYGVSEKPPKKFKGLIYATPVVQGIQLVPITTLPDRLRTVFPFPFFNAVQSKCFDKVFRSNNNFVLASPTGSGKTAILELAVCRTVAAKANDQYKIVYQAPTKALCSERQRDWETKFHSIGLKCAELTGDSDAANLRNVQSANIIITTPEKWDSITRRWKDHEKLMSMIKLFLIDEVHILKEDRGAVLETVVSRMKSIGTDVRFLALSATVPNFLDVAAWLGKNTSEPDEPAMHETFGEEFRPVKLRKHVCGYICNNSNDFAFERMLDSKLPEVISKYSERKPIMVFCATRNSTVNTAKLITKWWTSKRNDDRAWGGLSKPLPVLNKDLCQIVTSGVAFHHAGLDLDDRMLIEKAFLSGEISVICCTSTLAVGVNLPCHLVIIKNTVAFTANGLQEYSDLEMMQMLGRAGRPQFEDSAVAVIMTRQSKVHQYEKMVSGKELLESRLHLNLIDHVNAEIGLGTIRDISSARKWLTGTFLYIRLQQNPGHYEIDGTTSGRSIQEQVDEICFRDITLLRENNLISGQDLYRSTEFGQAMARYYVHFETMRLFMGIPSKSSPSEMLSVIAQATEFSTIRFRQGEKSFYKILNKSPSIRWSIPVNLDLPAQKVSLIIQSILGSADINWSGEIGKHRSQYLNEAHMIFKNTSSLIRCIIDCQVCLGDSTSIHSALLLERSLGSQAWDDSPLQMKQIEGIGVVAVRKFVNAGVRCMDDLEACEPHRIETLIGRNPPFGLQVLEKAKLFPKLHVSLHAQLSPITKVQNGVNIQIKAEVGFINEKAPHRFGNKLVYVCLLVETSDGRKAHFARISGSKLGSGQSLWMPVLLTSPNQSINCYVMCDGIGSMRSASVKPQVAPALFPTPEPAEPHQSNMSKRRIEGPDFNRKKSATSEDFGDDGIDDEELVQASFDHLDFDHIDNYADPTKTFNRKNIPKTNSLKNNQHGESGNNARITGAAVRDEIGEPLRLANGKRACNHKCKNKQSCRHICCKEGTDKPPKKKISVAKNAPLNGDGNEPLQEKYVRKEKNTQTKLKVTTLKRKVSAPIEELDLTQQEKKKKTQNGARQPRDLRGLHQLHQHVQGNIVPSSLQSVMHTKPQYCYSQGGSHNFSFMNEQAAIDSQYSSEYDDIQYDDAFSAHISSQRKVHNEYFNQPAGESRDFMEYPERVYIASQGSDAFEDDDSLLRDAMIGLVDSQYLQAATQENCDITESLKRTPDLEEETSCSLEDFCMNMNVKMVPQEMNATVPANNKTIEATRPSVEFTFPERVLPTVSTKGNAETLRRQSRPHRTTSIAPNLEGSQQGNNRMQMAPRDFSENMEEKENIDQLYLLDLAGGHPVTETTDEKSVVPKAFEGLEPWIFREFGDLVELVEE